MGRTIRRLISQWIAYRCRPRHRASALHPVLLLLLLMGGVVGLQAFVIAILSIVASRRDKRLPVGGFPYLHLPEVECDNNCLQIYSYGETLYQAMLEAIDSAEECIYLETFIWKDDAVGREFKRRLAAKADAGVKVYVIYDVFGNLVVPHKFKRFPRNIHVLPYWPLRRPWHVLDPRRYGFDHRKLLVVDGRVGFIGGYNIGTLYATEWRDTHLRIIGPEAMDLAQAFVDFWNRFGPRDDRIKKYYPRRFDPTISLRTNDVARLIFPIRDMYIDAIERAQKHIMLTNAYFIPDHVLLESLEAAAGRGVRVDVLVPWTSNHVLADWGARGYFTRCLRAGIHLWGYRDAMIHAKTCTIDGEWSTIGTANLDRLSEVGNYEINVEIYDREIAHQMERIFACDQTNAFELNAARWLRRPWYIKVSEVIVSPLRVGL